MSQFSERRPPVVESGAQPAGGSQGCRLKGPRERSCRPCALEQRPFGGATAERLNGMLLA